MPLQSDNTWKPEIPQESLVRSLFFKYLSYWPLFLILLILCVPGAYLYLRYKVPVYELKATIIIKDERKGQDDSKIVESLDAFDTKKIVENEIEVIKSKTLAQEVVRRLRLYAPITEKGRITDHSAYDISPIYISAKYPDSIKAADKVYFTYLKNKQQVSINGSVYAVKEWVNTPYGILKFTPRQKYQSSNDSKSLYFSLVPVTYVADNIIEELEVSASNKLSTVIDISLKDEVPQRGKAILNELIAAYNRSTLADKNVLAANTLSFVNDRLKVVALELDSIEAKLQHFKTQNRIVDINTQGKLFLDNVGDNDQKISDMNMQLAILNQVQSYVSDKGNSESVVPSTLGITDPVLTNLLNRLYNAELEYEKVKKIAPENNPVLVSLVDQINKIKPGILENIENQRKGLIAGRNDLIATNNKYTSALGSIPEKERELLEISRQQAIKNNIYTFLLEKREEAAISYASAIANSRLVDSAQASRYPVSPNKLAVYIIAVAIALGSGIGFITVRDLFNSNINSREEVERYTNITILSELVKSDSKTPIVISEDNRSFIAEQFRQLRTSLAYLNINSRKKKTLVTSAISGEGKSFVAVNLAMSLALANKKVVVIDLDMRRPALSNIFNITDADGMSQYLRGEKEVEAIIKRTDINPNLFFIPSGPIAINPSELLLDSKIQDLLKYLEGAFDNIIVDAPPVNFVTDAYILSPLCDATLYVIRQGVTPRAFVQTLDNNTHMKGLKNMAIIFNGVVGNRVNKYTKGYNLSYGYVENTKNKLKRKRTGKIL